MTKSFRERIRDAFTAKKQSKTDAERDSQTAVQDHLAKEKAAAQKSFQFMDAALKEAQAALTPQGLTVTVEPTTVYVNSTPETDTGHLIKVRHGLMKNHQIAFDYRNGFIGIDGTRERRVMVITSPAEAERLVSEILEKLDLI